LNYFYYFKKIFSKILIVLLIQIIYGKILLFFLTLNIYHLNELFVHSPLFFLQLFKNVFLISVQNLKKSHKKHKVLCLDGFKSNDCWGAEFKNAYYFVNFENNWYCFNFKNFDFWILQKYFLKIDFLFILVYLFENFSLNSNKGLVFWNSYLINSISYKTKIIFLFLYLFFFLFFLMKKFFLKLFNLSTLWV
jgi:hypothetical protein